MRWLETDGTIYFESGDGAYDAKAGQLPTSFEAFTFSNDSLKLKDYYSPSNHIWLTQRDLDMNATPVAFTYKGKEYLVGSGKEGRFFLLDTKSTRRGGSRDATVQDATVLQYQRELPDGRNMGQSCSLGGQGWNTVGAGTDGICACGEVSDCQRARAQRRHYRYEGCGQGQESFRWSRRGSRVT